MASSPFSRALLSCIRRKHELQRPWITLSKLDNVDAVIHSNKLSQLAPLGTLPKNKGFLFQPQWAAKYRPHWAKRSTPRGDITQTWFLEVKTPFIQCLGRTWNFRTNTCLYTWPDFFKDHFLFFENFISCARSHSFLSPSLPSTLVASPPKKKGKN